MLSVRAALTLGDLDLDLQFEVPAGITILFGRSGAGKSTTLDLIAGLRRPFRGEIACDGDLWFSDAAPDQTTPAHRRRVALVFQSLALFPHLTALENVAYGIDRGLSAPVRRGRAAAMLSRMKVAHVIDRKPASFSGGEAQRVALARACAMQPRVLLLDEPFNALEESLRRELGAALREVVAELEIPSILVTHDRNEARELGARAIVLERGRVTGRGGVDQLFDADRA